MGRRKKKRQGHYCWSCDRYMPNERFSGRGHSRHLCRECAKLGAAELSYRQDLRNIERCLNDDGTVRRKRRNFVQQFLGHDDLRLRAWADQLLTGIGFDDELFDDELFDDELDDDELFDDELFDDELDDDELFDDELDDDELFDDELDDDELFDDELFDDELDEDEPALYRTSTLDARSTVSCTARS